MTKEEILAKVKSESKSYELGMERTAFLEGADTVLREYATQEKQGGLSKDVFDDLITERYWKQYSEAMKQSQLEILEELRRRSVNSDNLLKSTNQIINELKGELK